MADGILQTAGAKKKPTAKKPVAKKPAAKKPAAKKPAAKKPAAKKLTQKAGAYEDDDFMGGPTNDLIEDLQALGNSLKRAQLLDRTAEDAAKELQEDGGMVKVEGPDGITRFVPRSNRNNKLARLAENAACLMAESEANIEMYAKISSPDFFKVPAQGILQRIGVKRTLVDRLRVSGVDADDLISEPKSKGAKPTKMEVEKALGGLADTCASIVALYVTEFNAYCLAMSEKRRKGDSLADFMRDCAARLATTLSVFKQRFGKAADIVVAKYAPGFTDADLDSLRKLLDPHMPANINGSAMLAASISETDRDVLDMFLLQVKYAIKWSSMKTKAATV